MQTRSFKQSVKSTENSFALVNPKPTYHHGQRRLATALGSLIIPMRPTHTQRWQHRKYLSPQHRMTSLHWDGSGHRNVWTKTSLLIRFRLRTASRRAAKSVQRLIKPESSLNPTFTVGNHRSVHFNVASLSSNVRSEPVSKSSLVTPSERALLTSLKSHEIDCGPATLHPSLANHLAVSDDCSYLPTVPQQPMDDPFLANHTVEGENCSYLVQPYSQLSVNGPGLTTLANYLEESDNCCYATGPYLRQTMDSSNAPNTSLSYSSWIAPNANTASDPEPQATVNSYDGFRASARSSCAAGYPYLPSRISTEVSNDFGSAHTDGVSMAMYLEVSEDDPHLRFDLRNPITLDPGIITSVQ